MALALLDVKRAQINARSTYEPDSEEVQLLDELSDRKLSVESEQALFAALCDRWDNLYYPQHFTAGGASHWADHISARKAGMSHISLNVYPAYVDIPASLQSVPPVENFVATDPDWNDIAAAAERVFTAWKADNEFDILFHQANVVKGLYGRTAGKVYWDDEAKRPKVQIIDQPRNLYLGWRDSNYTRLEWAIYTYSITPMTALEDWGVHIEERVNDKQERFPFVVFPSGDGAYDARLASADLRVEVYDYWYRKPKAGAKIRFGKPTKFETWNAIFVGNVMVKNQRHTEYDGAMPYVPLFNTYIPGLAEGRSEFYDVEQLIREKDEKISEISQMMSRAIKGQYWQLTGQEAPDTVPGHVKPTPNAVVAPGAGNRIEPITPWMPEFQAEGYLSRLDREMVEVTGLNDLLLGLSPSAVLSSSKAIAALVANYETRITMKRGFGYLWRRAVWALTATVWASKDAKTAGAFKDPKFRLEITPPTLTPRDDMEAAQLAMTLKEGKVWSLRRAMDRTGVDDPEGEMDLIREEQTDATLNPAQVQVMAQLLGILRSMGIQPQPEVAEIAGEQAGALNDVRALSAGAPPGSPMMNGPEGQMPQPNEQMPGNTPEGAAVGAGAPEQGMQDVTMQTMLKGGEPSSRILQQQQIEKQV